MVVNGLKKQPKLQLINGQHISHKIDFVFVCKNKINYNFIQSKQNQHHKMQTVLSGEEFKKQYGTTFYKVLTSDLTHHDFTYKLGLNVDTILFNPTGRCEPGGLYFTEIKNLFEFLYYGSKIGEIEILDDSQVYIEEDKFKCDKLVLTKIYEKECDILKMFKLAYKNGCKLDAYVCSYAAENGCLEILKWARENGYEWDADICYYAAKNGFLEVLKWAHENGCKFDINICYYAAKNGHLEILKWARENGYHWNDWNEYVCSYAAKNGHLEVLKWARENGCEWNESVCYHAAINGHLEVLKWARENGCKWSKEIAKFAADKWPTHFT